MKLTYLLFLNFFISIPSLANETLVKEVVSGRRTEKSFDINKDGKADYIEITEEDLLIEKKEDIDFDGTFDVVTYFQPSKEHLKIIEQRKFGGEPKKRISFWHEIKKSKTFSMTQIDENNDGTWDKEYQSYSELNQQKDDCAQRDSSFGPGLELSSDVMKAVNRSDEYVLTKWGHRIHKSCLDNGKGEWFLKRTELGSILKHPGISINPTSIQAYIKQGKDGDREFERTVFHKQLHYFGYLHNQDIEYPYTCEKCCFPSNDDNNDLKAMACKVCTGNYVGSTDINYVKDISAYGKLNYNSSHALSSTLNYLKENPKSAEGITYLAYNLS